jgi:hypothetical protein
LFIIVIPAAKFVRNKKDGFLTRQQKYEKQA